MKAFINATSHPSKKWSAREHSLCLQVSGADYIRDVWHPKVPVGATTDEMDAMVEDFVARIVRYDPVGVLIQGHFYITMATINKLTQYGIPTYMTMGRRTNNGTGSFIVESVVPYHTTSTPGGLKL